jgi:hypothetical protein
MFKLRPCDLLFLLADEQAERLNVLSHVALGGSELSHLISLSAAQHGISASRSSMRSGTASAVAQSA